MMLRRAMQSGIEDELPAGRSKQIIGGGMGGGAVAAAWAPSRRCSPSCPG